MTQLVADQLPQELARPLWRFVLRRRQVALLRAVALATMLSLLWWLAWGVVDRFIPLPSAIRMTLLAALVLAVGRILLTPLRAMLQGKVDWRGAAWQFEQRHPRLREALVTVVSQTLSPQAVRSSPQITAHLTSAVARQLRDEDPVSVVDFRPAIRAWWMAAAATVLFAVLAFWPWLDLPQLVLRQLSPFAAMPPVTHSRIVVEPGAVQVRHGSELVLTAQVQNAGSEGVILRTSADGANWNSTGMSLAPDGTYTRTLSSLSRDAQYEIRTGDAVSGPYPIRVLHHPIVREFRIRLEYPAHVDREPLTIDLGERPVEAPVGTRARIMVVASEPLRSAWFTINGNRSEVPTTADPAARQIDLTISNDTTIALRMVSERGMTGTGPEGLMIRAIPDRTPTARLLAPPGFSLVGPDGSLHLPYEALDDYAIASLRSRVEVDGVVRGEAPLALSGEPHRKAGVIHLRLADWEMRVGQIVAVSLVAGDRAGQVMVSPPARVLVWGEQVLPERRSQIAELKEAARLAAGVEAELESARRGLDAADQRSPNQRQATSRLALAAERSSRLVRSLLLAADGISGEPVAGLYHGLVDAAQVQAIRVEEANVISSVEDLPALRQRLSNLHAASTPLAAAIRDYWRGSSANVILAARRALAAVTDTTQPELARLREAIEAETAELGLDPRDPEVHQQLTRTDAAGRLIRSYPRPDVETMIEEWLLGGEGDSPLLADRLSAAAQVEAARADTDTAWAADLGRAARAVRALEASPPGVGGAVGSPGREMLQTAMNILWIDHEARRVNAGIAVRPPQAAVIDSRQFIAAWAADRPLAMLDRPTTQPQIPALATGRGAVPAVSETRDQGIAAIRRALEIMTELPQVLYELEQAAKVTRAARNRLQDAIRDSEAAAPDELAAAQRAVAAEEETVNENIEDMIDAAQPIDFSQLTALSGQLRRFLPDTTSAVAAIEQPFIPAMNTLSLAINNQDAEEVERSVALARQAIAIVQQTLRDSQATLRARDPTIAARTFAATTRPTTQSAVLDALRRSWDDPVRRLIESQNVPQQSVSLNSQIATTGPSSPPDVPAIASPWRFDDPAFILRDDDPPQYREALDIYFQMLESAEPQSP